MHVNYFRYLKLKILRTAMHTYFKPMSKNSNVQEISWWRQKFVFYKILKVLWWASGWSVGNKAGREIHCGAKITRLAQLYLHSCWTVYVHISLSLCAELISHLQYGFLHVPLPQDFICPLPPDFLPHLLLLLPIFISSSSNSTELFLFLLFSTVA